jgi:hypothetical protein
LIITGADPKEPKDILLARTILRPSVSGGLALYKIEGRELGDNSDLTVDSLTRELVHQCAEVVKGDMTRPEAILTAQAHTLDALFSDLIRLAYQNLNNFCACEQLFRLAFKAQGQARATVETLGALKNPPTVFVKQANVTTGPQQVNNGVARARESENQPNKLLERSNGERLDLGAPRSASGVNIPLEPVGAVNGAKVSGG